MVIWLIGISGSGKTTIGENLTEKLRKKARLELTYKVETRKIIDDHVYDVVEFVELLIA